MPRREMLKDDPERLLAQGLLVRALRDPFAEPIVREWFRFMVEQFPLLSFQANAYQGLHASDLPTTYPLGITIESILRDDGINLEGQALDPLPAALDRRRHGIARKALEGGDPTGAGYTQFLPSLASDLGLWEPESDHTAGGFVSPYDGIGRELVQCIEAFRFAFNKTERQNARRQLEAFLQAVGGKLLPGQPAPPVRVLEALLAETRRLVGYCAEALREFEISDRTRIIVAAHQVSEGAMAPWAARLALPVLSRLELRALLFWAVQNGDSVAAIRDRDVQHALLGLTPLRFAIWQLARRLGVEAPSLARMLSGSKASYFQEAPNPIDGLIRY